MEKLENNTLQVFISAKGAELQHIKFEGKEMLWQGNPQWWARRSPVLFPVVGKCADDIIRVNGKQFPMTQHGFARDKEFIISHKTTQNSIFLLSEASNDHFPFPYQLEIEYSLSENRLRVDYRVTNKGLENLHFSIGAHPGFLIPSQNLNNCYIEFEKQETGPRHLLDSGLFNGKTLLVEMENRTLPISPAQFDLDAIVLKNTKSKSLKLFDSGKQLLEMRWENMPHLGIWTKQNCEEFLCLEPWAGYADSVDFAGEFSDKEAVETCAPGKTSNFMWEVGF